MAKPNDKNRITAGLARLLGLPGVDWSEFAPDILEEMPVALLATAEGVIKFANRRARRTFGYSSEELIGQPISRLLPGDGSAKTFPKYQSPVTVEAEHEGVRKDGSRFPVHVHVRLVDAKGSPYTLVAAEDLSKERELEAMKAEFLAMITHDLRSPLSAASMNLSMLRDGSYGHLPERALHSVKSTEDIVSRLIRLTNDLLLLGKLESPSFRLDSKSISIEEFIDPSLASVASEADKKDVTFTFRTAHLKDIRVMGDRDRIVQVLVNLMSNAVKHSPEGASVSVQCDHQDNFLRVSVVDLGKGIPGEMLGRIFEKYAQVDDVGDMKAGGFGLGLAICKSIIEKHGGQIGVMSNGNSGSEFWFTLPCSLAG